LSRSTHAVLQRQSLQHPHRHREPARCGQVTDILILHILSLSNCAPRHLSVSVASPLAYASPAPFSRQPKLLPPLLTSFRDKHLGRLYTARFLLRGTRSQLEMMPHGSPADLFASWGRSPPMCSSMSIMRLAHVSASRRLRHLP
jgi:hypothetical protein